MPGAPARSRAAMTRLTRHLPTNLRRRWTSSALLPVIVANSGWLLAEKILRMCLVLVLGVWIARHLGPTDFGVLSYATAFVSLFAMLAALGLDGIVVRELTIHPERRDAILGSAFALKIASGLLVYLATVGTILLIEPGSRQMVFIVSVIAGSLVFQAADVADFWFQSQLQAKYVALARITGLLASSAFKTLLLLKGAGVSAFAWTVLAEGVLTAFALFAAFQYTGNHASALRLQWTIARRLMADSWPLAISGMLVALTMQLDKILLGEISGHDAVGIYSVASQLSSVWYMVPVVLGASLAPSLARAHAGGDPSHRARVQRVYDALAKVSIAMATLTFLLADPIIALLFGDAYAGSARVLAIHTWSAVFVFHVSIRSRVLIAERKQGYVTRIAALTLLASIALNLVLIPAFGAPGAAWASFASWALCAMVFPLFWPDTRWSVPMFVASITPSRNR